jgi:tetratricopeptide (TPR) repeat protein
VRLLEAESAVFKGGMTREAEIELLHREIRMNPLFGRTRADRQLALRYAELQESADGELYSNRARASEMLDDTERAIDHMGRVVELDPSADARTAFDEVNALRARLAAAMHRANGYDARESQRLADEGRRMLEAGDFAGSLDSYRTALISYPYNAEAYRGLVRTYVNAGLGMGYARSLARKAVMMDQSAESYRVLADVLRAMGNVAGAERALKMTASG